MEQPNWSKETPYCIYKHTSPSGKIYIGQTSKKNLNERWCSGGGYKKCSIFSAAIEKYGWENFEHEILECNLTKDEADLLEVFYIAQAKNLGISYNVLDGGSKLTQDDKLRISESLKGRYAGKNNPMYGTISPIRDKIRIWKDSGEMFVTVDELDSYILNGWMRGLSDESKQKLRNQFLGRVWIKKDGVTKQVTRLDAEALLNDGWKVGRISNERWCKPKSNDTKQKISTKNSGGIYINDGKSCKHISHDQLDIYLKKGWVIGQLKPSKNRFSEKMKGRVFIHKDDVQKMVSKLDVDDYLIDGWKLGRNK